MGRGFAEIRNLSTTKDEWLTPEHIIRALGPFDLDPSAPVVRPWPTATKHYSIEDDGLSQPWDGCVWLNPPYSRSQIKEWINRMVAHNNGIALLAARTDTAIWQKLIFPTATAISFLEGRIRFCHVNGTPAQGSFTSPLVLIAWGKDNAAKLKRVKGSIMTLAK